MATSTTGHRGGGWVRDLLVGGLVGGIVGAVIAVNVVILSGVEQGYEASMAEVFRQNDLVGVLVVGILLAGPVAGVAVARRRRRPPGSTGR